MNDAPRRITLAEWEQRYVALRAAGLREPSYGGPLGRHVDDGSRMEGYLCGSPGMIDAAAAVLHERGVAEEHTFYDKFA